MDREHPEQKKEREWDSAGSYIGSPRKLVRVQSGAQEPHSHSLCTSAVILNRNAPSQDFVCWIEVKPDCASE